jgi:hypothetical protein
MPLVSEFSPLFHFAAGYLVGLLSPASPPGDRVDPALRCVSFCAGYFSVRERLLTTQVTMSFIGWYARQLGMVISDEFSLIDTT